MFCPQCGAEYRSGFSRCADCDVDLVDEAAAGEESGEGPLDPVSHAGLVCVCTFTSEFEAQIARSALAAAGIEAAVRRDSEGGLNPGLAFTRGVELLVRSEDAVEARDILEAEEPGAG